MAQRCPELYEHSNGWLDQFPFTVAIFFWISYQYSNDNSLDRKVVGAVEIWLNLESTADSLRAYPITGPAATTSQDEQI
jgi:hypothetical protein